MKRWTAWLAVLGGLAGLAAVLWVFGLGGGAREPEELPVTLARTGEAEGPTTLGAPAPPKGGVYAGTVVDAGGKPVAGATVLLVAFDAGDELPAAGTSGAAPGEWDPSLVAVVDYRLAAEGRADAEGRFRIAADARSAVRHVVAYQPGYMPEAVPVRGPAEGIVLVLAEAGQFVGTVVDAETGRPVPGVDVSIYLQSKAAPAPPPGHEGGGGTAVPLHSLVALQRFVARVLGPRVWGVVPRGDDALHLTTDSEGRFRIGPVGNAVQLEFVLTHAEYMWTEHDLRDQQVRRTVVDPGQTVERTFRLERGKWIEGRVVNEGGEGVPDVRVEIEHVAQYAQHWYYRDRKRVAITGKDGSFRVAGLSWGPYNAVLRHPSFGLVHIHAVPENTSGLLWGVHSVGALLGTVEGLERAPAGAKVEVLLEAAHEGTVASEKRTVTLDATASFRWPDLAPGRYAVWVRAGNRASLPEEVEVRSGEVTAVRFGLGGGGGLEVGIRDAAGRPLDPATGTLVQVLPEGDRTLGQFVSRGGVLSADGLRPGRYRLQLAAPGYLSRTTDPFEVLDRGTVRLGEVRLPRQAFVRIVKVDLPRGASSRDIVEIHVREGDGAWRRVLLVGPDALGVPVAPGPVTVKAESSGGARFEQTYDVPDGGRVDVEVVLR